MVKFHVESVEYGDEVFFVRSAPAIAMIDLLEKQKDLDDMKFNFALVAASLCNKNGTNGVDTSVEEIGSWPWSLVAELIKAATSVNGFAEIVEAVEDSKKN